MAISAPNPVDVTHFQFKLQDKIKLFTVDEDVPSNINLVAVSNTYGILVLGNPKRPEIKVVEIPKLIESKEQEYKLPVRTIAIPGLPHNITSNADGSLVVVNFMQHHTSLLNVYDVPSFLSKNVVVKIKIPITSLIGNVQVQQIAWNPVICSSFGLVASNGALSVYNLKNDSFELHSYKKSEIAQTACWSPKGKQIVVGFPNGKLMQFKPDLIVARTIDCPGNVCETDFDTIAVQWLSVYQFAAIFLEKGEDKYPCLFIINAPKTGSPIYISYGDVCYSSTGPRIGQIFLNHVPQWNVLMVASANSVEVGMLGTTESGEAPNWQQYIPPDEARIELPLNQDKQETYPVGFVLDTTSKHQIIIGESEMPVMPMVHMLSTDGLLVSFNFLNMAPSAMGICSPPRPISDLSGYDQFHPYDVMPIATVEVASLPQSVATSVPANNQTACDLTFSIASGQTSTPAGNVKSQSIFSQLSGSNQSVSSNVISKPFATLPADGIKLNSGNTVAPIKFQQSSLPKFGEKLSFSVANFGNTSPSLGQQQTVITSGNTMATTVANTTNKPLFGQSGQQKTIPDTTKALYDVSNLNPQQSATVTDLNKFANNTLDYISDVDDILIEMIVNEIKTFEVELGEHLLRLKDSGSMMGKLSEKNGFAEQLNALQNFGDETSEATICLGTDIQLMRQTIIESFEMLAEVRSSLEISKNPRTSHLAVVPKIIQANNRQLTQFRKSIATRKAELESVMRQVDAKIMSHQDVVKIRKRMQIPSLEVIYQTLTTYNDILCRQRVKLEAIKTKMNKKDIIKDIEYINDSLMSMALHSDQGDDDENLLDGEDMGKISALESMLRRRKVVVIKPQRPKARPLDSEVILEKKKMKEKLKQKEKQKFESKQQLEQSNYGAHQVQDVTRNIAGKTNQQQLFSVAHQQQQQHNLQLQQSVMKPQSTQFQSSALPKILQPQEQQQQQYQQQQQQKNQQQYQQNQQQHQQQQQYSQQAQLFSKLMQPPTTAKLPDSNELTNIEATEKTAAIPNSKDLLSNEAKSPEKSNATTTSGEKTLLNAFAPKSDSSSTTSIFSGFAKQPHDARKSEQPFFSSGFSLSQPNKSEPKSIFQSGFTGIGQSALSTGLTFDIKKTTSSVLLDEQNQNLTKSPEQQPTTSSSAGLITSPFSKINTSELGVTKESNIFKLTPDVSDSLLGSLRICSPSSLEETSTSTAKPLPTGTQPVSFFGTPSLLTKTTGSKTDIFGTGFSTVSAPSTTATTSTTPSTISATVNPALSIFGGFKTSSLGETIKFGSTPTAAEPIVPQSLFADNLTLNKPAPPTTANASISNSSAPVAATNTTSAVGTILFGSGAVQTSATTTQPSVFGLPPAVGSGVGFMWATNSAVTSAGSTAATKASTSTGITPLTTSSSTIAPLFGDVKPTDFTTASTSKPSVFTTSETSTAAPSSVFGAVSLTSQASTATPLTATTPTIISAPTTTTVPSLFGATTTTATTITTTSNVSAESFFKSAITISTAATSIGSPPNAFGNALPKPEQSVFDQSVTVTSAASPFGADKPTSQPSPFGSPISGQSLSGGNIFGGSGGFGSLSTATSGTSLFGGSSTTTSQQANPFANAAVGTTTSTASLFGAPKVDTATSIFGASTQSNQTSGGSLFGGPAFGTNTAQSTGSIFGGSVGGSGVGTGFGTSTFGQQSSLFSGTQFGSSGFGSFGQTTDFSSGSVPNASVDAQNQSPFVSSGPSISQTGFGSVGTNNFVKPAFGASTSFGAPPAFGSSPTFGGAPTFGGIKNPFGSFAQPANIPGAFSPPQQKNNLFESLGSSDTGPSFGNLAQNANAGAAKPQFGGSSFSNWR